MVDLKEFLDAYHPSMGSYDMFVKPNLRDLDNQISVVITELIPIFLPFYHRCFCVSAVAELDTRLLITRFEALEAIRAVKTTHLHELSERIISQQVRQRAGELTTEIESLCQKRDQTFSQIVGDGFQQQIIQKARELAPLRSLLREYEALTQELRIFSSHALVDLCQTLRRYLTSVEDWEVLSRTVRPNLRDRILVLGRLEKQRIASVSDLLGYETEA
ncbi:TPA: hypothetical protein DCW61_04410 [Candidatus Uhrbacteria bacterium]|nr:hypothetical protein [Candidatus Uhrbacteria bacterium]